MCLTVETFFASPPVHAGFSCWTGQVASLLAIALSCEAVGTLNHLNCGTVGTVMRGGAIGATLEAFALPLGSTCILANALLAAAFGRAPPAPPECPIPAEPPPRANEAAGKAKSAKRTKATFTEVFDMGKLH
jgi:hypothetical protein